MAEKVGNKIIDCQPFKTFNFKKLQTFNLKVGNFLKLKVKFCKNTLNLNCI